MDFQKLFINNAWVDGHSGKWIEVENPTTKDIIAKVPRGNAEDVADAVQAAREAFRPWSQTKMSFRLHLLRDALERLRPLQDTLTELEIDELGQPRDWTQNIHVERNFDRYESFLEIAEAYDPVRTLDSGRVVREPIGVVACLTPWNYPLGQVVQKVVPALLAGNTVILKPSQHTPLSVYYLTQALSEAGLPAGVFNLVTGRGSEVGDALCTHPEVDMVSFTGSTKAGKGVACQAMDTVKKIALELGGKSPAVMLPGCDPEKEVPKVLGSCFPNSGQTCSAFTRLIIPREEEDAIEATLVKLAEEWKAGDPRDPAHHLGPLVNEGQFERVRDYIQLGVEEGARMLVGEQDFSQPYVIQPVVFTDVTADMRIAQEEIFGPVLCVQKYDTIDEALSLANGVAYGLVAAVYGPDELAQPFARALKAGQVYVNDGSRDVMGPFGGYKASGLGREGGLEGFEEFFEIKSIFD